MDPEQMFDEVALIATGLKELGLRPVLVGGMALVLLGSQRVTQDFDFVVSHPGEQIDDVVAVFYRRNFELVSKLNARGEVTATIEKQKVAAVRLSLDAPPSAFFCNRNTPLRIDLLFDFPIAAAELNLTADRIKIGGRVLTLASAEDLLRLKEIAAKKRKFAGDAQDIEFLRALLRGERG